MPLKEKISSLYYAAPVAFSRPGDNPQFCGWLFGKFSSTLNGWVLRSDTELCQPIRGRYVKLWTNERACTVAEFICVMILKQNLSARALLSLCHPDSHTLIDQSEASILVTWSLSTNQRPVSWPRDHSGLIRGQHSPRCPAPPPAPGSAWSGWRPPAQICRSWCSEETGELS